MSGHVYGWREALAYVVRMGVGDPKWFMRVFGHQMPRRPMVTR